MLYVSVCVFLLCFCLCKCHGFITDYCMYYSMLVLELLNVLEEIDFYLLSVLVLSNVSCGAHKTHLLCYCLCECLCMSAMSSYLRPIAIAVFLQMFKM